MILLLLASLFVLYATTRQTLLKIVLYLPATGLHELSHWVVALVTGKVRGLPSVLPSKTAEGWQLGHVTFEVGFFSAGLIALAPAYLLAPLAYWALSYPVFGLKDLVLYSLIGGYAFIGSIPSSTDLNIALANPVGSLVGCFLLYGEYLYIVEKVTIPLY